MKLKEKTRKLIKLNYSFYLSMPMNWIRTLDLKQGDMIEPIIQEDGSLLLNPIKCEGDNANTTQ